MKSDFLAIHRTLVRLIHSFVDDYGRSCPEWNLSHSVSEPGAEVFVPDDIPIPRVFSSSYKNSVYIRCQRSCCCKGPDEMAHELLLFFNLYEEDDEVLFRLDLGGLPDHDEETFPRIEGSTEYDIDSLPEIRFSAPTVESVLEAAKRLLDQVPEWHRFLAADSTDWETRLEMRME